MMMNWMQEDGYECYGDDDDDDDDDDDGSIY